ncbi:hypothetical protein AGR1C_pAt40381 [Agrobacterium fabacearum TT111]|nr:hypothetical protein AGR1C_pAt40381 [Agrobacterium fabacearum TT111]
MLLYTLRRDTVATGAERPGRDRCDGYALGARDSIPSAAQSDAIFQNIYSLSVYSGIRWMASLILASNTHAVLYSTPILRDRCSAAMPFTAVMSSRITTRSFLNVSLREWNTVPEVTENLRMHSPSEQSIINYGSLTKPERHLDKLLVGDLGHRDTVISRQCMVRGDDQFEMIGGLTLIFRSTRFVPTKAASILPFLSRSIRSPVPRRAPCERS